MFDSIWKCSRRIHTIPAERGLTMTLSSRRGPWVFIAFSALGSILMVTSVQAQGQGWYGQLSLSYDQLSRSNGETVIQVTSDETNDCILGNLGGLGSLLTGTVGPVPGLGDLLVADGCLLELIGPGDSQLVASERAVPTSIRFKGGLGVMAAVGYGLQGGLRPELAVHAARNDFDRVTLSVDGASIETDSNNRFDALGVLANLWWDFMDSPAVRPYIGGGIGFQSLRLKGGGASASDSSGVYQLGAGVGFPLSDHFQLSLDYRFLRQSSPRFDREGDRLEAEYKRQSIMLGARYFLGGTARGASADTGRRDTDLSARPDTTPLEPAVVPVESDLDRFLRDGEIDSSFVLQGVRFEFDSDRLLPESIEILEEVAASLKRFPTVRVETEGHTCIIGSSGYNLTLSERRANAVRAFLMDRGIASSRMVPVGYGESRPIGDNSIESGRAQNRRVEFRVIER